MSSEPPEPTVPPEPTRQLLLRGQEGDEDAMRVVLQRHRRPLRKLIASRLDRAIAARVDASDVVQDVLWEASRRVDEFLANPGVSFQVWLRRLAHDRIIDMYRRHRAAARRSVDRERQLNGPAQGQSSVELLGQLRTDAPSPLEDAIRRELAQRFVTALEQLSEMDREVISMRHFEQMTNQEVAEALECSHATAGMRYLRALRRLGKVLKDMDVSHGRGEN